MISPWMRRSSAAAKRGLDALMVAASTSGENSRPITAATWATCLISPNRSAAPSTVMQGGRDRQQPTRLGKLEPLPGLK